ncbi:plasmid replication protein, CyRepA1 family [Ralstonia nicotianae]
MDRRYKVAVNPRIINKVDKNDKAQCGVLTWNFKNEELTLAELANVVKEGHPFCAHHHDGRKTEHFICSDVLAVDIDGGMRLEEALEDPYVRQHAGFVYPTVSHTVDAHRFRMVFALERTITDPQEMRAAYVGLIRRFGGDGSCKDACRLFYGARGCQPIMLGNVLPNDELDRIIALGRDASSVPDRVSDGKRTKYAPVARRSGVELLPTEAINLADGSVMALGAAPFGASIHCPEHIDRNPSAFIVKSEEGNRGVYCHRCAATFWMRNGKRRRRPTGHDFYQIEEIVLRNEHEENPANVYDEDEAPQGLFDMALAQRAHFSMTKRLLPAIPVHEGVTFIRSPKGSGKSEQVDKLVAHYRRQGQSVLLVGHRQALLRANAERFGLTCYMYADGSRVRNNKPSPYYAICLDSMAKLLTPEFNKYDVVILDESEQIFSHLTGGTLKEKRRDCYMQLFHYLAVAKAVIVADADLGPITIEGLRQAMGPNAGYHFYLNGYREAQRDFHHYGSETHLMQEMLQAIRNGGRHYVSTNSIRKAEELQEAIRQQIGAHPKVMLVTSETVGRDEVQAFIADIKRAILDYDVVIATPTLGTGIDITFEDNAQHIDTVFGFFVSRVNTHFDVDQQIARVRHPKAIKVWVSPEEYQFETEPEVILYEARMSGALNDAVIGYEHSGARVFDETYLNVYAHVMAVGRASKNALRQNLLELRARNGWNVVYVDIDKDEADVGKEVHREAKAAVKAAQIRDVCGAERLDPEAYDVMSESAAPMRKSDEDAMRRYEIERFYGEDVSPRLVVQDDDGRYRPKLRLLETYLSSVGELVVQDLRDAERSVILTDAKKRALKQLVLKALLTSAGLAGEGEPVRHEAVITSNDLGSFIETCHENSARLQDLFGMALRGDLDTKPMSQLGKILELMGLSLEKVSAKHVPGDKSKKTYYYRIHREEWQTAMDYVERRRVANEPRPLLLAA